MTDPSSTISPDPGLFDLPPPSGAEVRAAQQDVHKAAVATSAFLPRAVERIASAVAVRQGRKYGLIALVVSLIIPTLVSLVALTSARAASDNAAYAIVASQQAQASVDTAMGKLGQANSVLTARGQAPVATPPDATPTEAITAAVLAQVLAQLPRTPTADDVAARLETAVTSNVIGPTMDELTAKVSRYFASNDLTPPGPTQEQIQAAVDRNLAGRDLTGPRGERGEPGPVGAPGVQGPAGADSTVPGPPGPAGSCPDGTQLAPVLFGDLQEGQGCVNT